MKKGFIPTVILILVVLVPWPIYKATAGPSAGQITVVPTSGLITTESGGQANFTISVNPPPSSAVKVGIQSLDPSEGTVLPLTEVTFNKNYKSQVVTITGVDDSIVDGDILYVIQTLPAQSSDKNYDGVNPSDISVTNWDNEGGPVANPDTATTVEDQAVITNVLANDALNLLPNIVTISKPPAHGTAKVNLDNSITDTPTPGYTGDDLYGYQVCDTHQRCSTANVTITIKPLNKAPQAGDDAYTVNQDTTLKLNAPGVLSNDTDQNQDSLSVTLIPNSGPTHGLLSLQATGAFVYTPTVGYAGQDLFNYQATDGQALSNIAKVTIEVKDTAAPVLNWSSPAANSQVYQVDHDGLVKLSVNTSDNAGVTSVFYNRWDPVLMKYVDIAQVLVQPFSTSLDTSQLRYGWNQVFARAFDGAGNPSERQFVWFFKPFRILVPFLQK